MSVVLVSVVIPVYNVQDYLKECVESVVNQTYKELEIIIVDDGSTDGSGAICDRYAEKDKRITVIHKKNEGLGNARNIGTNLAQGEYIIFLDSDDYWLENTIEKLVSIAERDNLDVLQFSGESFPDTEEDEMPKALSYKHIFQNNIVKNGVDSYEYAIKHQEYYTSTCMRLYRLEYLQKKNLKFDEGIIHEDEKLSFLAYINAERVECIGDAVYQRRWRKGSIMTSRSAQMSAYGYSVAMKGLIEVYKKNRNESNEKKNQMILSRIIFLINIIREMYIDIKNQSAQIKGYKEIAEVTRDNFRYIKLIKNDLRWSDSVLRFGLSKGCALLFVYNNVKIRVNKARALFKSR